MSCRRKAPRRLRPHLSHDPCDPRDSSVPIIKQRVGNLCSMNKEKQSVSTIHSCIHPFTHQPIHPPTHLSICPSTQPSIHHSIQSTLPKGHDLLQKQNIVHAQCLASKIYNVLYVYIYIKVILYIDYRCHLYMASDSDTPFMAVTKFFFYFFFQISSYKRRDST